MTATATIDLPAIRRRYHALLTRHQALDLCAELGAGERAFKQWCKSSPVEGMEFRVILSGHGRHRYRRDTILTACGVLPALPPPIQPNQPNDHENAPR